MLSLIHRLLQKQDLEEWSFPGEGWLVWWVED